MFQALQRLRSIFKNPTKVTADISSATPEAPADAADYRVYTREFDVVVDADKLHTVLGKLEGEDQIQYLGACRTYNFALTDWRTGATVKALAASDRIRAVRTAEELRETAITLLVDQSGSMRGQNILLTAAACDIALDFLRNLGIVTEILGFTTIRWKGGRSRQLWQSRGRPHLPGRLNDILHIVYKSAVAGSGTGPSRPLQQMLRPDLLKENIDGEAIEWAVERLEAIEAKRKVLIVLSDGAPVDDSTLSQNDGSILERHLRQVTGHIQAAGDIKLIGLGIAHDTACYFENAQTIQSVSDLGTVLISTLENAIRDTPASPAQTSTASENKT
jgi:cobaltochelatase CobT